MVGLVDLQALHGANIRAKRCVESQRSAHKTPRTNAVKGEFFCLYMYPSNHIIRPIGLMLEVKWKTRQCQIHGIEPPPTLNCGFEAVS
jgi:hypothetical protein